MQNVEGVDIIFDGDERRARRPLKKSKGLWQTRVGLTSTNHKPRTDHIDPGGLLAETQVADIQEKVI